MTRNRALLFVFVAALGPISTASAASAQPPSEPPAQVERRSADLGEGVVARLVTRWAPDERASGASLAIGDAAPTILFQGPSAGAVERGERVSIVAYEAYDRAAPFRYRVIRRAADGHTLEAERHFARPGARTMDSPFAVAIAPIPGRGFALFYEEVQSDDPSGARSYLFMLDLDGAPMGEGREIQVPWPIAAAAWNGHGFHLGLVYPGGGDGMRLSMVSLTPEGTPEQHPDWSSAAGFISDVHLVVDGTSIHAHYRGGSGGDRWFESDVSVIGSWGRQAPPATDHGRFELDATLVVHANGNLERIGPREDGLSSTPRRERVRRSR